MIDMLRVHFRALFESEKAATAVEYAIMAGFIAAVIVAAVAGLGQAVVGLFTPPGGSWPF